MPYYSLHGEPTRTGRATASDGTRLAWEVFGEPSKTGRPAVVCCNGVGCSTFFWHYISRYFSQEGEVVLWDYRGHGVSDPPADPNRVSIEDNADDLEAVLKSAGIDHAVTVGHSMGCQVILEHHRRHPARVRAMVPMLGTYGKATQTFFNTDLVARFFPLLHTLSKRLHPQIRSVLVFTARNPLSPFLAGAVGLVNGKMIRKADLLPYLEHMASLDPRLFMDMARHLGEHSAEDALANIKVPVLIIGGELDAFTPVWLSEKMHRMILNSEMTILPGGSHAALVEQPEFINLRVDKFLRERVLEGARVESATARVLEDTSDTRVHMQ